MTARKRASTDHLESPNKKSRRTAEDEDAPYGEQPPKTAASRQRRQSKGKAKAVTLSETIPIVNIPDPPQPRWVLIRQEYTLDSNTHAKKVLEKPYNCTLVIMKVYCEW